MSIGLSAGCLKLEAVLSRQTWQTRHLGTLTWGGPYVNTQEPETCRVAFNKQLISMFQYEVVILCRD